MFFALSIPTKLFIADMVPKFALKFWAQPGILYHAYLIYFFSYAILAIDVLRKELRSSGSEKKKIQYKYVLAGTIIGYVGGSTNFPLWYNIPIYPMANVLVTLYVAIIAYAILRHNLLDIEVVIKRTVVFAGLVAGVMATVATVAFISQALLAQVVSTPLMVSNVVAAAIVVVLYRPLRAWLVNVTDRYLFQKQYDYKDLLRKLMDEVITIVDLRELVQKTVNTIAETVRLGSCSLLLFNKETRRYEVAASYKKNAQHLEPLDEQEQLITFLRATYEPISTNGHLEQVVRFPEAVKRQLERFNVRLCLPLHVHDELVGILCLGKKRSDEAYSREDVEVLMPLAGTLGIAVSNAQLFAELARTQAEAAQREKLAVIGTLSAGINHEICNPLGIVKAQCEAFLLDLDDGLLEGKPLPEIMDRSTAVMRGAIKQIDRATAITQKLSNFAKPIKEPSAQPLSVAEELNEVLLLIGHDLKLEKIALKQEIQPDLPRIAADRRQIQEVLFNLLRNAAQAITPPGTITIRAAYQGGRVHVEIEDTGSGIPPEKLEKIYDPFFTTKGPGEGTGLGLFIVRQIVERNHGHIAVESTVGRGTTFVLDFAAADEATVTA